MKDKEARMDIAGLEDKVDFLKRKLNKLEEKIDKEPTLAVYDKTYFTFMLRPREVSIAYAVRLILKHLELEIEYVYETPEHYQLKEIVDDDNT